MRRAGLIITTLAFATAACTRPNPRSCLDGVCDTAEYPFCDVNGTLGGVENECIAVSCVPGAFAECRGSSVVMCDDEGDDYVVETCSLGCEENIGCRVCEPNQTACTGSVLASCDEAGAVTQMTTCALGCADSSRCVELVPSNNLLDHVVGADYPTLNLLNATIDVDTGDIVGGDPVPSFLIPTVIGGREIRLLVASTATLENVTVTASPNGTKPALAIFALGDLEIRGSLVLSTANSAAAGAYDDANCSGGEALGSSVVSSEGGAVVKVAYGGGGGGHATAGGAGGAIPFVATAQARPGGAAFGSDPIVPLRGGCGMKLTSGGHATTGGGAVQLVSASEVRVDGVVDVRGQAGRRVIESGSGQPVTTPLGGGAGGAILIEAPSVRLLGQSKLLASGGGGASIEEDGQRSDTNAFAQGGSCVSEERCGFGGAGAHIATPGGNGFDPMAMQAPQQGDEYGCGAGGGGVGRIRINTSNAAFAESVGTLKVGVITTGVIETR